MNKKLMWLAFGIFCLTAGLAVIVNSLLGTGLRFDYTISRYVGLETWSAVVFAVGNFVVAGAMLHHLYGMVEEWRMSRWVCWLIIAMLVGLIGLSVCPIGYFDPEGARYGTSVISLIHGLCSRMMFMSMLVMMGVIVACTMASRKTRVLGAIFVAYGLLCLYGYLTKAGWFESVVLVSETAYIVGFMVLCLELKSKKITRGDEHGRAKR